MVGINDIIGGEWLAVTPFGILVQFDLQGQIVGPFILGTQRGSNSPVS